jgi:hypothetical protein
MKTHSDKIFSMAQQFASKSDSKVGSISTLFFLHFTSHDEHFSGWMLDFELFQDGGGITGDKSFIDVVNDHFFES